jgi:hypothetical protein
MTIHHQVAAATPRYPRRLQKGDLRQGSGSMDDEGGSHASPRSAAEALRGGRTSLLLPGVNGALVGLQWALYMHGCAGPEHADVVPGAPTVEVARQPRST